MVFVEGAVPGGAVVPESWRALPALSPAERVGLMVSVMGETVGEHLPRTLRGLRERCVDAELAVHGGEYFVVYTFINEEPEVAERARHCYMFYEDASGAPFTLDILADRVERAGDLWWIDSTREYHVDFWGVLDQLLEAVIVPLEDRGPRTGR